ncbi:MAG: RDD family protein, partial [Gemmatimonadota bacterium]
IVTPYAFRVAPDLLGLPLAGPTRRALGMLIDLMVIGAFALLGWTATLAFIAFVLVVHFTAKDGAFGRVLIRLPVRALALVVLVVLVFGRPVSWVSSVIEDLAGPQLASVTGGQSDGGATLEPDDGLTLEADGDAGALISPADLLRTGRDAIRLARTDDSTEARTLARSLAEELRRQGLTPAEITEVLGELGADSAKAPAKWRAVRMEAARLDSARRELRASEDSLLAAYFTAVQEDTVRARILRPLIVEALSGDTLEALSGRLERREGELLEAREELEERRGFSLLRLAGNLAEDLGLGFGLSGVYFTLFTIWWRGRTPGKRIVGERVVKLNGKPMTWWDSFNRFGGYAAGIATGTLGFLELIWDANRQAAHDKMVGTVVLRTRGNGIPPVQSPS